MFHRPDASSRADETPIRFVLASSICWTIDACMHSWHDCAPGSSIGSLRIEFIQSTLVDPQLGVSTVRGR